MFNYDGIDKHVTAFDLAIIATWLISNNMGHYMVSSIDRERGKRIYDIHLTNAYTGFNRKIKIGDNNEIEVIERDKESFWMS